MKTNKASLQEILGADFAEKLFVELGIQHDSPSEQEAVFLAVGTNIMSHIMFEILKIVPRDKHDELERFWGSNDIRGMRSFLLSYIPELDRFIQYEAMKELEATKTRAAELTQGV
ncbi:MAG: hypothetical protein WA021_02630 [Minisyncoccia bacterium]